MLLDAVPRHTERIDVTRPELAEIYIVGSYGAGTATEHSDVDITIGLLPTEDVRAVDQDTWIEFSQYLTDALSPYPEYILDIMVMPRDTWFFEHMQSRARHGSYETMYDLYSREHCPVADVCKSGIAAFTDE